MFMMNLVNSFVLNVFIHVLDVPLKLNVKPVVMMDFMVFKMNLVTSFVLNVFLHVLNVPLKLNVKPVALLLA